MPVLNASFVEVSKYITNPISLIAYVCAIVTFYFISRNEIDRKRLTSNPKGYQSTAERLNIDFSGIPEAERTQVVLRILKNRIASQLITALSLIVGGLIFTFVLIHFIDPVSDKATVTDQHDHAADTSATVNHDPVDKYAGAWRRVEVSFDQIWVFTKIGPDSFRVTLNTDCCSHVGYGKISDPGNSSVFEFTRTMGDCVTTYVATLEYFPDLTIHIKIIADAGSACVSAGSTDNIELKKIKPD